VSFGLAGSRLPRGPAGPGAGEPAVCARALYASRHHQTRAV